MNRKFFIANGILWAAAILATAIVGAPPVLSVILLPTLATCSFLTLAGRRCLPKSILKSAEPVGSSPFGVIGGRSRNDDR